MQSISVRCHDKIVDSILQNQKQCEFLSNIHLQPRILSEEKVALSKLGAPIVNLIHQDVYSLRGLLKPRGVYNQLDIPLCSEFTEEILEYRQHRESHYSPPSIKFPSPISPLPTVSKELLKKNTNGFFNKQKLAYRMSQHRRIKRNAITFTFNARERRERAKYLSARINHKSKLSLNRGSKDLLLEMPPCSVKLERLSEEYIANSTILSEIESCMAELSNNLSTKCEKTVDNYPQTIYNQERKVYETRQRAPFNKYIDTPIRTKSFKPTTRKCVVMSPVSYEVKEFVHLNCVTKKMNQKTSPKKQVNSKKTKKKTLKKRPIRIRRKAKVNKKLSRFTLPVSGPKSVRVIISPATKERADIFLNNSAFQKEPEEETISILDPSDSTEQYCKSHSNTVLNYSSDEQHSWPEIESLSSISVTDQSSFKSGRVISASLLSSQKMDSLKDAKCLSNCKQIIDSNLNSFDSAAELSLNFHSNSLKYRYKIVRSDSTTSDHCNSVSSTSNSVKSSCASLSSNERVPLNELTVHDKDSQSSMNHSSAASCQACNQICLHCSSVSCSHCQVQADSLSDSTIETPRFSKSQRRPTRRNKYDSSDST